jgi:LmbE family N-acetylglucosaminyl deacetylase
MIFGYKIAILGPASVIARSLAMTRFATPIVLAALLPIGCNQSSTPPQEKPTVTVEEKPQARPSPDAKGSGGGAVDLLVFGPHPDDEVLACAGIIRQALTAGKRVKVVLCTNGDGLPDFASSLARKPEAELTPEDFLNLARHRQMQSQASFDILGGKKEDLIFLGYPDAGFDQVYDAKGKEPFQQKFTRKSETYGAAQPDYHSAVHGRPSPYTYDAALADFVELIRTLKPSEIYVTNEGDEHLDHKAAFRFVRDALKAVGHPCELFTYANHAGPEWPWPLGFTPKDRFEAHDVKGQQSPRGVPWPPTRRVLLPPEVVQLKLRAIQASMIPMAEGGQRRFAFRRQYFESFAKVEEVFWAVDTK